MKALRSFAAVVVTVAVVVALGVGLQHTGAARWIGGATPARPTPRRPPPSLLLRQRTAGHVERGFAGPNFSDARNLGSTVVIAAVIGAAVVAIDSAYRRKRQHARRS